MVVEMIGALINKLGIIIILAVIISKIGIFKKLLIKKNANLKEKFFLAIIFGTIGILGTYSSVPVQGALANTRVVGVMVGALLGGPFVGIGAAVIAGGHRYLIDIGGFTAVACGISTMVEGMIGGYFYYYIKHKKNKWIYALGIGVVAEIVQMGIILLVARPFADALALVQIILVPMVFVNAVGIALFVGILENIYKEQERIAAGQAEKALKIANLTMPYFRQGLTPEVAKNVVAIIYEIADAGAVAITNEREILAHKGLGEDHHIGMEPLRTMATKEVIASGKHQIINQSRGIYCAEKGCPLKSAIIVPLKEQKKTVGTLKIYKSEEYNITHLDEELALGLGQLFSTQIEVSKVAAQEKLLVDAELKTLQAQINPHFLFNAINTIQSFMIIDGKKAKLLLTSLATLFRKSLSIQEDFVDFSTEIDHIKSYLEIEEARFGDRLQVDFQLQREHKVKLPPLILQPIVENAVIHGILPKKEGGVITIRSRENVKECVVEIQDNGLGMAEEVLGNLFKEQREQNSVGLMNVHKRLVNLYGEGYGLIVHSREGTGTTVEIRIPVAVP